MIYTYIFTSLIIGIMIGAIIMYYRARYLLDNQKTLYNELQDNKIKLNEYQKELSNHFNYTMKLVNKMANDYRNLYDNIKKSANFFLPNTHIQENVHTLSIKTTKTNDEQKVPITVPLDYSDNKENTLKKHDNK